MPTVWFELIFSEPELLSEEMSSFTAPGPRDFLGEALKSVFLRFWIQAWLGPISTLSWLLHSLRQHDHFSPYPSLLLFRPSLTYWLEVEHLWFLS